MYDNHLLEFDLERLIFEGNLEEKNNKIKIQKINLN